MWQFVNPRDLTSHHSNGVSHLITYLTPNLIRLSSAIKFKPNPKLSSKRESSSSSYFEGNLLPLRKGKTKIVFSDTPVLDFPHIKVVFLQRWILYAYKKRFFTLKVHEYNVLVYIFMLRTYIVSLYSRIPQGFGCSWLNLFASQAVNLQVSWTRNAQTRVQVHLWLECSPCEHKQHYIRMKNYPGKLSSLTLELLTYNTRGESR